jgi:hypothetical protein
MAYTAPNSFSVGAKIVASAVEQNIDVLQSYVNGGVSSVDIDTSALNNPFGLRHVMKGEYFALNNRYEFATGPVQGTLGSNQAAGHSANILGNTTGQQVSASGTGIDFYLEEDADVFVHITAYPRQYNGGNSAEVGLAGRTTTFTLKRTGDPVLKKTTQGVNFTESEFGVSSTASNDGGIYALERRRPYYAMHQEFLTAGEYSYSLRIGSNERTVPIHYYQINIYAYYRDTTS